MKRRPPRRQGRAREGWKRKGERRAAPQPAWRQAVGGRGQDAREKRRRAGGRGGRGGRAGAGGALGTRRAGELKRGVGEPRSQMGKSYANSALPGANQCRPSALPRDWLAPEEEGPRHPESRPTSLPAPAHARVLRRLRRAVRARVSASGGRELRAAHAPPRPLSRARKAKLQRSRRARRFC